MAYLPGVPDMGPAPVKPTIASPGKATVGAPHGIAAVAARTGKPGRTEHLGSIVGRRGAGMSTGTGGDSALHSMGHYGKKAPPLLGGPQIEGGVDVTAHPGAKMIRGQTGVMRSHIREGGLGPGRMGMPGPTDQNYSQVATDSE